jgi:chromate reductase, NAD(P)H dehydrogenase (quinone)
MRKKVIAICGSTRTSSSNLNLIKAIAELAQGKFDVTTFAGLADLSHFNPDLDNEAPPPSITHFRNALRIHDGILICTPEYAMGVPGTLKNAIDWTVSSMEFSHKPTVLITASSLGHKGHQSLLETLQIIEAKVTDETQFVISHIKTKINAAGQITDEKTRNAVQSVIVAFDALMTE